MTTDSSNPQVRYATLRDYLRVLRRYWVMILIVTAVGAVAGFVYAKTQSAFYKATAEVAFQDPLQQLGVVGLSANQPQTPGQLAAVAADLVTAPNVMNQVRRELHTSASAQSLSDDISAQVAIPSNLLQISAAASDPRSTADLANATARALVAQDNAQTRQQYARMGAQVPQQNRAL